MSNIFFAILCAIAVLLLITVAFLNFDVFSNIVNSPSYALGVSTAAKQAHTYFLISFIIILIAIIVFIMGIAIVGYGKITKHGKDGKNMSIENLKKEAKKLIAKIKYGKSTASDVAKLEGDEVLIKKSSSEDGKFTIVLFIIALLSLITLVLTCVGQYYLGQAKSAQNDSFITKAYNEAWFSIGLSLLALIIVLTVVGIKIKSYVSESEVVKSAKNALLSAKAKF